MYTIENSIIITGKSNTQELILCHNGPVMIFIPKDNMIQILGCS